MSDAKDILIVGGAGVVGRRIAALLAPTFDDRLVIGGRDLGRAEAVCREFGHGARGRRIDVEDPAAVGAALDDIGTVVTCVAQQELHLLRAAIERGLAYTDIAPRLAFWGGAETLALEARQAGACIVLGAGLSPGISNMMALQLAEALGSVERIETNILLSLGDEYGPDSLEHVLSAVTGPFTVLEDGRRRDAVPFSQGQRVDFPEPIGARVAYLFPWSDVVYYPETLGARTALGRFALEPAWAGRLASFLVRHGGRWLGQTGLRNRHRRGIERLKRRYAGHDRFALVVAVEAGGSAMTMRLSGRHQADVTAAGAAEIARMLAAGEVAQPGLWLPEQVIPHERFFERLARHGFRPEVMKSVAPARTMAP